MCFVCFEREPRAGTTMCRQCCRSYDEAQRKSCDVLSVLIWAAERARWFEKRRKAKAARA